MVNDKLDKSEKFILMDMNDELKNPEEFIKTQLIDTAYYLETKEDIEYLYYLIVTTRQSTLFKLQP